MNRLRLSLFTVNEHRTELEAGILGMASFLHCDGMP